MTISWESEPGLLRAEVELAHRQRLWLEHTPLAAGAYLLHAQDARGATGGRLVSIVLTDTELAELGEAIVAMRWVAGGGSGGEGEG